MALSYQIQAVRTKNHWQGNDKTDFSARLECLNWIVMSVPYWLLYIDIVAVKPEVVLAFCQFILKDLFYSYLSLRASTVQLSALHQPFNPFLNVRIKGLTLHSSLNIASVISSVKSHCYGLMLVSAGPYVAVADFSNVLLVWTVTCPLYMKVSMQSQMHTCTQKNFHIDLHAYTAIQFDSLCSIFPVFT